MEILTAVGMASSAGLNAYIPLLVAGLLSRFTDVLSLGPGWQWLENPWALGILAVLLVVELLADKIPVLDHVNDVVQTLVRPTAGGIVFGASGTAATGEAAAAAADSGDGGVWMIVTGAAIALFFHAVKAVVRLAVNAVSGGTGAPVVSTAEDAVSTVMAVLAVLLPALVALLTLVMAVGGVWLAVRLRRRRKQREGDAGRGGSSGEPHSRHRADSA